MRSLPETLAPHGFSMRASREDWLVLQRQGLSMAKLGMLDTFVIATERAHLTPDELKAFSADAMREGRRLKFGLPCGLFSVLVTYPVVYVERIGPEVSAMIAEYSPKHFSAFEFPVIAERSTRRLHYCSKTPVWGAVYMAGFRAEVEQFLAL